MSFKEHVTNSPIKKTCELAYLLKRVKFVDWFHFW